MTRRITSLAVVLDGLPLRAWQRDAILLAAREVDVRVVAPASPMIDRHREQARLVHAFNRWDHSRASANMRREVSDTRLGMPTVTVLRFFDAASGVRWITVQEPDQIASAVVGCDVILDFSGDPEGLAHALAERPRLGVWFYENAGVPLSDGTGVGFDVLARSARTAALSLIALDGSLRFLCWRS